MELTTQEKLDAFRNQARDALANDDHIDALDAICEANGWTREEFIMSRHEFHEMELFLLQFGPSIPQLKFFPYLVSLQLHHVGLTEMKHIDTLVHLEVLWMSENDIQKIECLENCEKLRELYLHNNQIRKIEGMRRLKNLQVLWLNRNQITSIAEMEYLPKLQSLWIAGNQIHTLRNAFPQPMPNLQELNVASNKISSFRDIPILNELKALEKLYFSDPQYGDNPVCQLSNYQTFTLFHLQQVRVLDYVNISMEQRQLAESTFIKKKIYYSMRMNTIQRNLSILLEATSSLSGRKLIEAQTSMTVLERLERDVEQDAEEFGAYGTTTSPETTHRTKEHYDSCCKILSKIRSAIGSRRREMQLIDRKRCDAFLAMHQSSEAYVSRLMLELNTGGNVRLEEGKPKEVWYQSCAELLRTRYFSSDFESFGIKDIKVAKVTRIHNRGLRSRFDHALGSLVDLSDTTYKRALEYLFFALPTDSDATLNEAMEHGFGSEHVLASLAAGRGSSGSPSHPAFCGVPMTNSVLLADQLRLLREHKAGHLSTTSPDFNPDVLTGRIVVSKVFLGKCMSEKTTGVVHLPSEPLVLAPQRIQREEYGYSTASIYRCKPQDPKQRIWYCFEPELVLPEYLVDFTYVAASPTVAQPALAEYGPSNSDEVLQQFKTMFPSSSPIDVADFRAIGAHCLSFINWCETSPFSAIATRDAAEVLANPIPFSNRRPIGGELQDSHLESYIDKTSGGREDAPLVTVNLHSLKITLLNISPSVMNLHFAQLTELVLYDNELTSVPWADVSKAAPLLTTIDLCHNALKRVNSISTASFPKLKSLLLEHNFLVTLDDIRCIGVAAPNLEVLSIAQNPIALEKRAETYCCMVLPNITTLSQNVVAEHPDLQKKRATPKELSAQVFGYLIPMVDGQCGGMLTGDGPLIADVSRILKLYDEAVESYTQQVLSSKGGTPPNPFVSPNGPPLQPHVIAINNSQIEKLDPLEKFRRLTTLHLRSNFIVDMEPLMALTHLETLDLQDNRIHRITGLASLTKLKRLDVSKNYIEKIEGLETLRSLQYLSLSHNNVSTLSPLSSATSLLELYLSNNAIASEKEAVYLRDLPKLIILDLAGNPCVTLELYRSYVVFQIKRLKVLDGISIDANETQQSRDTFAGRISAELLKERLATGTDWSLARELNLASCALKEITLLETFTALTHLKLEHNQLISIEGLRCCVSLVALNLSHNKLGTCVVGKVFECMTHLESLSLEANGVTSIAFLQLNCQRLKFLNLKSNDIVKIDGLDRVGQLREILLDKNKLRAIDRDSLLFVPYLRELYCEENAIKTIEGINVAVQLQKVSFASNRISEVADVGKFIEGLPITDICFLGNPVVRKAYYRNHLIHSLPHAQVIDNRVVTPEERERVEASYQQDTIPPNVFTDVRMPMQGGPIVVPVPPAQKVQLKVMSLDAMDSPSAPMLQGATAQAVPGNRGRPAQSGAKMISANAVPQAPRTSSADTRVQGPGGPPSGPPRSGGGLNPSPKPAGAPGNVVSQPASFRKK